MQVEVIFFLFLPPGLSGLSISTQASNSRHNALINAGTVGYDCALVNLQAIFMILFKFKALHLFMIVNFDKAFFRR